MVADVAAGRARAAASAFGFEHHGASIEEMADSDCDVVHVLLPPALHVEATSAMLRAGKHVLVEKPITIDHASAASLAQLARDQGVALGVNHNFLFGRHYQQVRDLVSSGAIGKLDRLEIDWLLELPFIKHGPFDNWIVSAPVNPLFEIGAHPFAFALDLLGSFKLISAQARSPVDLPSGIPVPRRWTITGESATASICIHISFLPGHAERSLRVRGGGGSINYDYGRDILSVAKSVTDNPMLDSRATARSTASQLRKQASRDYWRRVRSAVTGLPGSNPFEESIFSSISAFYSRLPGELDERHSADFGSQTIALCEEAAEVSGLGQPSKAALSIPMPKPLRAPDVLVVGGTGFIGRKLIEKLTSAGHSVRVASRSARHAAMVFRNQPVEIFAGHHGTPQSAQAMLDGIRTVYHLAKCEGKRWQDYVDGDLNPTTVLGLAAAKGKVERFIYTGTIDSYNSASSSTTIDNDTSTDRRIDARNLYARSKAACEKALRSIEAEHGLPLVVMRPGIVIGPGAPPFHLGVGRFTSATRVEFWGRGENKLPLVHVDDVADALASAATADGMAGKSFLIVGPPLLSAQEYVRALEQAARIRIEQMRRSPWRFWIADFAKEAVKHLIRHPNRRRSTLHDWRCKTHSSAYDSNPTSAAINWRPISDRQLLIQRGIVDAVE
jgi:nucleoside-diphosphate-sugar epimerase/predicted dehydrogenase